MTSIILLILMISPFGAHPILGVSIEEMQNLDVQLVITEKLQDCFLNILHIKTHADYSHISNPYVLSDFVSSELKNSKQRENIQVFKAQNLHCNFVIVITGDILDISPPWDYRPKRDMVSFRIRGITSFVKAKVVNARAFPMLLLILHCDLMTNYLFDKISRYVRHEYFNARTFVLSPEKAENNLQTYSGYYICWFYIPCRIHFRCSGSDCINTMMETFDLATNFGKQFTWAHLIFQEHFEIEVGIMLGSPFRRKQPWTHLKTIYHFLIEDFYCNCSVVYAKANRLRIGASEATWSNRLIPLFHTSGFHFITSDGVKASKLEMISLYTSPFEIVVWIAVALSTILTCIALASKCVVSNKFDYGRSEIDDVILYEDSRSRIFPSQFRCVAGNYLSMDISRILVYPKTALVVYSQHLEYYWEKFEIIMDWTELKFAHNGKVKDDNFLRRWNYLFVPLSWSKKYDYIGNRAHVMMSSGLFMFWERWHNIRFERGRTGRIDSRDDHMVKALDLESSIVFVFYGFLWSALGCTLIFVVEIVHAICSHHKCLIWRYIGQ
ncbi:unnamed protein product [Allacma fusca]|uniref:Uncharacterized protein n=1 Tax=Allacma fusca TaxID=39272 RepID=A0A8J2KIC4_9HEXA|nr:unnamed protein product [Allacma fusca]